MKADFPIELVPIEHNPTDCADCSIRRLALFKGVKESDLAWTIICPGGLRDDEGKGLVSVSEEIRLEGITTRDNLAAALVACLDLDNTIGKRFSLLEGETPMIDALRSV